MKWKSVVCVICIVCVCGKCGLLSQPVSLLAANHKSTLTTLNATRSRYIETFGDSSARPHYALQGMVWDVANPKIELEALPKPQQTAPTAVADIAGNIILAWSDTRLGNADIYAQKLDATGKPVWPRDIRVNSDTGPTEQTHPAIALDDAGNAIIAWGASSDLDNLDNRTLNKLCCNLHAQKLDAAGNKVWPADSRINQNPNTVADDAPPALALLPDGLIVAAWGDTRAPLTGIYLQKLNANGKALAPSDTLFVLPALTANESPSGQRNPVLRTLGNHLALAWADCLNNLTTQCEARAQQLDSTFTPIWPTPIALSAITTTLLMSATRPLDIAVDQTDRAIVAAWADQRDGHADIFAQRISMDGKRLWANDVRVNSDVGASTQSAVAVDVSAFGSVFAWLDQRQTNPGVFAQRINALGDKQWTVDARASDADALLPANAMPFVRAISPTATLAWPDSRTGYTTLLAQQITITGERAGLTHTRASVSDTRFVATGVITSPVLITNTTFAPVRWARLVTDYEANGGAVTFYLSNGNGWITATPGLALGFPITGSTLAWKAMMLANPRQTRSPRISRVQIDYGDATPSRSDEAEDNYEPDDTCNTATDTQINGAAQPHHFHRNGDADWLRFEVVTGTTYVLQTSHAQSNADTQLELFTDCAQPPVASNQSTLGNNARVVWRASAQSMVWARISNNPPTTFGPDSGYAFSVRAHATVSASTSITAAIITPLVIIVTGRNTITDALQANFNAVGDQAYRAFIATGTPKTRIRYLSANTSRDPDGNGSNDDIYASPTLTRVREAIQTWARQMGAGPGVPVYVVVAQHGAPDELILDADQRVRAAELDLWLRNLEAATDSDQVTIVIEGSQSGSFIEAMPSNPATISARNRVIVASTSFGMNAYPAQAQFAGTIFSDMFWTGLAHSQDVLLAYETAQAAVAQHGLLQNPQLDDNGDGAANALDGGQAHAQGIGPRTGSDIPVIDFVSVEERVNNRTTARTQAKAHFGFSHVWVDVYAPDFVEPALAAGLMPTLTVTQSVFTPAGGNLFAAQLSGLDQAGCYRLVVSAKDTDGNYALPQVTQACNPFTLFVPIVRRD